MVLEECVLSVDNAVNSDPKTSINNKEDVNKFQNKWKQTGAELGQDQDRL